MVSLANSLVRDGTSRFFRWLRGCDRTRAPKVPVTMVTGTPRPPKRVMSGEVMGLIQRCMSCGCQLLHSTLFEYPSAKIGGLRFSAGDKLKPGTRCGSVVVMRRDNRSVYGLVKKFFRVDCACCRFNDLACVTWFPYPEYPDGDPLTVRITLNGLDVNNIHTVDVVSLDDIQPSRIIVDIDTLHDCMYMLRIEGLDKY